MKKNISLIAMIVIVFITSGCHSAAGPGESAKPEIQKSVPATDSKLIEQATLLIVAESIQPGGVTLGCEMGTLVQYQGETYLVTHNHYGDMLQDANILELRDAENRMIRPIYGQEFKSLIIYQDPGTLVLRAPDGLTDALTPVNLDHRSQPQPGDAVQVAHRGGEKRDKVEILDAVIEKITVSGTTPVYRLRSLDGQRLAPGDSGGGIWYDGNLVGNNWAIVLTSTTTEISGDNDPASLTQTDLSTAAMLPEIFH